MADNSFQLRKSADEGPINPIEETKRLGANLAKTNFKCGNFKLRQVKESSEFSAIFQIQ